MNINRKAKVILLGLLIYQPYNSPDDEVVLRGALLRNGEMRYQALRFVGEF